MNPQARKALERVARLNPEAGEIGAGMLRTIVTEAQDALDANSTPTLNNLRFWFGAVWPDENDDPGSIHSTICNLSGGELFKLETSVDTLTADFMEDWPDGIPADDCASARALIKVLREAADKIEGHIK